MRTTPTDGPFTRLTEEYTLTDLPVRGSIPESLDGRYLRNGPNLALVESGVASYELTDELDTIGVCDFDGTLTGGYTAHPKRDPGCTVGEFVFQQNDTDAAEDDGVLMGYVYDRASDSSELAILDAGTLDEIGAIVLPHRVPVGFHGNWVPTG